jgi:hypothetical protein
MVHPSDDGREEVPLPATAPLLGPDGSLIYTTSDGRQVIVCDDPSLAQRPELLEAFPALRAGAQELDQAGRAAEEWITVAARCGVPRELALRLLVTRLRLHSDGAAGDGHGEFDG